MFDLRLYGLIVLLIFISNQVSAQQIQREGFVFTNYTYNGGEISYKKTLQLLSENPETLPYAEQIRKYNRGQKIAGAVSLVTVLGVIVHSESLPEGEVLSRTVGGVYQTVFLASLGVANVYYFLSRREMYHALKAYNEKPFQSRILLNQNGIGVQLSF